MCICLIPRVAPAPPAPGTGPAAGRPVPALGMESRSRSGPCSALRAAVSHLSLTKPGRGCHGPEGGWGSPSPGNAGNQATELRVEPSPLDVQAPDQRATLFLLDTLGPLGPTARTHVGQTTGRGGGSAPKHTSGRARLSQRPGWRPRLTPAPPPPRGCTQPGLGRPFPVRITQLGIREKGHGLRQQRSWTRPGRGGNSPSCRPASCPMPLSGVWRPQRQKRGSRGFLTPDMPSPSHRGPRAARPLPTQAHLSHLSSACRTRAL